MSAVVIGKLKNGSGEVNVIPLSPKIPPSAEKDVEKQEQIQPQEEALQGGQVLDNSAVPAVVRNISKKETKFFSEPKRVKKKTEGSILGFQVITSFLFCLVLLLSRLGASQLYDNLQLFLSRVFK